MHARLMIGLAGGALVLAGCSGTVDGKPLADPTAAQAPLYGPSEEVTPKVKALGQTWLAVYEEDRWTVLADNWRPTPASEIDEFTKPRAGTQFWDVTVTQEQITGDYGYNSMYFVLKTPDGTRIESELIDPDGQNDFGSGELRAGEKTKGQVTFEVPIGVTPDRLVYESALGSTIGTWSLT